MTSRFIQHRPVAALRRKTVIGCLAAGVAVLAAQAAAVVAGPATAPAVAGTVDFARDVRPILQDRCVACHGPLKQKGGLRLDSRASLLRGGVSGPAVVPGRAADSRLIQLVAGVDPTAVMPPKGDRLSPAQVAVLREWVDRGAGGTDDASAAKLEDRRDHWSFKPLVRPAVPAVPADVARFARNPVDAFVLAKLAERGLTPSPEADRRTLIRRLAFDLTGLPPTPDEVDAFAADAAADAYEKLVDRLLASPRYGERWARHWLDVARYADTHGYDKDKPRPNAWPYRDYVIRAFNEDKPYARFVGEQLAGDKLYPGTRDGVVALGFLAAGPWDLVGQTELREGTLDKAVTRNLDRDDMVAATANAFVGLTAQCARCHDHKFDPISQEDYYSLQAVFAAVDRADRAYEADPSAAARRAALQDRRDQLAARARLVEQAAANDRQAGPELRAVDARIASAARAAEATALGSGAKERPEFGYHSQIAPSSDVAKWVQVDLGRARPIDKVVLVGAHDTFANIGAGFGFPVRYKVELSDDPTFATGVAVVANHTAADVPNPGVRPQPIAAGGRPARYVRVTATKLAERTRDYIFSLGEVSVLAADGTNLAAGAAVTALDSIEAPPRWGAANLVDGYYFGRPANNGPKVEPFFANGQDVEALRDRRHAVLRAALPPGERGAFDALAAEQTSVAAELAVLGPPASRVFAAATTFEPAGSFRPTLGVARPVRLLRRGSEKDPGPEVGPGTVGAIAGLPSRFALPAGHDEADRRAALAAWVTDPRNPLTWRTIVNRVWQGHFGRGIVETPSDLGRMGARPTHPELLDWLAAEFRDGSAAGRDGPTAARDGGAFVRTPGSLKGLHKLIVTSATYRQASADDPAKAWLDAGNQYLWRASRRRLDAESVRDALLAVGGRLDLTMGGPGFRAFGFEDDHSPRYDYAAADPDDPRTCRRSVYRFVVRSVPDPLMEALDCADPSQSVPRRTETLTPLQALALLNDKLALRTAEHLADRAKSLGATDGDRAAAAFRLALGRPPAEAERRTLAEVAAKHGLPAACRVVLNLNEFVFVD